MRLIILALLFCVIVGVAGCNGYGDPLHPRYGTYVATKEDLRDISLITGCSFEGVWARNRSVHWDYFTIEAYCLDTDESFFCLNTVKSEEATFIDGVVTTWKCEPSDPNDAERAFREYQDAQE